ncbi:uncharacterized protein LOC111706073, partial [Eurytemora carolleeae]|uniref:uncharacterized protein LOC111706073 n=1 Tax=Eurytemora carolleeae TaxID=1294199 RepID=UPI000C78F6A3
MYRTHSSLSLRIVAGVSLTVDWTLLDLTKAVSFELMLPTTSSNNKTKLKSSAGILFTKDILRAVMLDTYKTNDSFLSGKYISATLQEIVSDEAVQNRSASAYHPNHIRKTRHMLSFSEASQARLGSKLFLTTRIRS